VDLSQSPSSEIFWELTSIDAKVQISKKLSIFTPYLGAGFSYAFSTLGYRVTAPLLNGAPVETETKFDYGDALGTVLVTPTELSSSGKGTGFSLRAFGGFSLSFASFVIDLTGLAGIPLSGGALPWGASLGLRFQQ
jgi:hypothetical protein